MHKMLDINSWNCMLPGSLSCGHSAPIYRHLVWGFFIKTLIIMFISINIDIPYVCDPSSLYISLVRNSIGLIIAYWSTLINYSHQHIDKLIKHRFSPIDRFSCQPLECQATPRTLEDLEYITTPWWNLPVISYHVCIIFHAHKIHEWLRVWSTIKP